MQDEKWKVHRFLITGIISYKTFCLYIEIRRWEKLNIYKKNTKKAAMNFSIV